MSHPPGTGILPSAGDVGHRADSGAGDREQPRHWVPAFTGMTNHCVAQLPSPRRTRSRERINPASSIRPLDIAPSTDGRPTVLRGEIFGGIH
jgi:hypothetical protein